MASLVGTAKLMTILDADARSTFAQQAFTLTILSGELKSPILGIGV
jgi:hypothetical protein